MPSKLAKELLLDYQYKIRCDDAQFRCSVLPRQSGKDFTHMEEAVALAQCSAKTDVLVTAPGERQAIEALDKAKDWAECYSFPIEGIHEDRESPKALINAKTITFPNRSRIIAVPGTPKLARGYCAHTFITEFAFLDDPDETFAAILPSVTNEMKGLKKMRVYSTPMGKQGKFFDIVDKNLLSLDPGMVPEWSVHHMNVYQCIAQGMKANVEKLKKTMNDDERFAREYMCEFADQSNVLLPYPLILAAESADAWEVLPPDFFALRQQFPVFCGVDFGRTNDPTVCWMLQKIGGIFWTREVLVLKNMPMPMQWQILQPRFKLAAKTSLDYTGLGTYIGDDAALMYGLHDPDKMRHGKIDLCTFTANLKRELFPRLRRSFESPINIRIPISVDIREDLHAMQQVVKNAQYDYYAPRTKDGHSDRCTALALAVRAAECGGGVAMGFSGAAQDSRFGSAMKDRRNRSLVG